MWTSTDIFTRAKKTLLCRAKGHYPNYYYSCNNNNNSKLQTNSSLTSWRNSNWFRGKGNDSDSKDAMHNFANQYIYKPLQTLK